jgi:hypothetical protein
MGWFKSSHSSYRSKGCTSLDMCFEARCVYWYHRPWPFLAKNCSENVSRRESDSSHSQELRSQSPTGRTSPCGPPPFRISFEGSVSIFFSRARCFDRACLLTPGGWSTLVRPCTCQYLPIRQQMCKRSGTLCR